MSGATDPVKGIGYGALLEVDPLGGTSFVTVGGIVDGFENESERKKVDTTLLADKYETSLPSQVDPGTLDFELALNPSSTQNTQITALFGSGAVANWRITYPNDNTNKETFLGWVKTVGRTVKVDEMLTRKISIQLTDNPGHFGS